MYQPSTGFSNIAPSATDSNIVSAVPGKRIRVVGGWAVAAGTATNITFNTKPTGSGVAISSTIYCGINGGICWPSPDGMPTGEPPIGYFETSVGEGLTATTGAGASVGVTVRYITI